MLGADAGLAGLHLSARLEMTVLPQISWRKISGSGKSVLILDGCPHNSNPDRQ